MTVKIIEDTFTDTDSVLLSAHVGEVGADWSVPTITPTPAGAKAEIINNALVLGGTFASNARSAVITALPPGDYGHAPYSFVFTLNSPTLLAVGNIYTLKMVNAGGGNDWIKIEVQNVSSAINVKVTLADGATGNVDVTAGATFVVEVLHKTKTDVEVSVNSALLASSALSEFEFSSSALTHTWTMTEDSPTDLPTPQVDLEKLSVIGGSVYFQDTFTDDDDTVLTAHEGEINAAYGTVIVSKPTGATNFKTIDNELTPSEADQGGERELRLNTDLISPPFPVEYVFTVRANLLPNSNFFWSLIRKDNAAVIAKVSATTVGGQVRIAGIVQTVLSGVKDVSVGTTVEVAVRFNTASDADVVIDGVVITSTTGATYPTGQLLDLNLKEQVFTGEPVPPPLGVLKDLTVRVPVSGPPLLVDITPIENSIIPLTPSFVLSFSENVSPGFGNINLIDTDSGAGTLIFNVNDTSQVFFVGSTITITPLTLLKAGVSFNVVVAADVIVDADGQPFAGIIGYAVSTGAWISHVGTKEI